MADSHGHDDHQDHTRLYYTIGATLAIATALSFVFNWTIGQNMTSAILIMIVAVIKACLVSWIFMHLKWDWSKLYYLIIPAFILGAMMMMVLLPDIVFAWMGPQDFEVPLQ